MRGKTVEKKCVWCKTIFHPRIADVKRGWGKYCSKGCKASKQTQVTGQAGPVRYSGNFLVTKNILIGRIKDE